MELNVYKKIGETTAELSTRIKKQYNAKKVAVCGKLDPMARGLTKVLLDDKTKLMEKYLTNDKTYEFKIVFNIKTDTDDIMGLIVDYDKLEDEDISSYIRYIDEILNKDQQHFHPFSAIKVKIDDRRQSLHQWTQERKISMEDLPIKNVKVISKEYGNMQKLTVKKYITNVLNRLSTISDQQKTTFRVPDIKSKWINFTTETGISNKDKLLILPVKLRVSSGFYIRMIPYYLKELFNINAHIYDIHRTRL